MAPDPCPRASVQKSRLHRIPDVRKQAVWRPGTLRFGLINRLRAAGRASRSESVLRGISGYCGDRALTYGAESLHPKSWTHKIPDVYKQAIWRPGTLRFGPLNRLCAAGRASRSESVLRWPSGGWDGLSKQRAASAKPPPHRIPSLQRSRPSRSRSRVSRRTIHWKSRVRSCPGSLIPRYCL